MTHALSMTENYRLALTPGSLGTKWSDHSCPACRLFNCVTLMAFLFNINKDATSVT